MANIWDTVNNPPEEQQTWYGKVSINAYEAMLVKGQGRLPYDPNYRDDQGKPARKVTAIELAIDPITKRDTSFEIVRNMTAEFGEWKDVVLPSLRSLGVMDASTLNGKWAAVDMVGTGRKYETKNGEQREATAMKFVAIFENEAACKAAMNQNAPADDPAPWGASATVAAPVNGNGSDTEKETALKFASAYVQNAMRQANKDLSQAQTILTPLFAGQPLISKHFNVNSPEIINLLLAEAAK